MESKVTHSLKVMEQAWSLWDGSTSTESMGTHFLDEIREAENGCQKGLKAQNDNNAQATWDAGRHRIRWPWKYRVNDHSPPREATTRIIHYVSMISKHRVDHHSLSTRDATGTIQCMNLCIWLLGDHSRARKDTTRMIWSDRKPRDNVYDDSRTAWVP